MEESWTCPSELFRRHRQLSFGNLGRAWWRVFSSPGGSQFWDGSAVGSCWALEAEGSGFWRVKTIRNGMVIPEKLWSWWCFSQEWWWWWWWWREEKRREEKQQSKRSKSPWLPTSLMPKTHSLLPSPVHIPKGIFQPADLDFPE